MEEKLKHIYAVLQAIESQSIVTSSKKPIQIGHEESKHLRDVSEHDLGEILDKLADDEKAIGIAWKPNALDMLNNYGVVKTDRFDAYYQETKSEVEALKSDFDQLSDYFRLISHKEALYYLKLFYSSSVNLMDAMFGYNVGYRDTALNHYYVMFRHFIDTILQRDDFRELAECRPVVYENILGDIEGMGEEWEFVERAAYDYLAKIVDQYILAGSPSYDHGEPLQEALDHAWRILDEHKKNANRRFNDMMEYAKQQSSPTQEREGEEGVGDNPPFATRWEDITIRFLNGHDVHIATNDTRRDADYQTMGLCKKNGKPSKQWDLLSRFAEGRGELEWHDSFHSGLALKKRKAKLSAALKKYFNIDDEPIVYDPRLETYKIKINITPVSGA